MNVNRARSLLVLVNIGLAAGTGYTVYKEFDNKAERKRETLVFQERLQADLKNA
jgi:hypothetical protein